VVMSSRERAMIVSTSSFIGVVDSSKPNMKIKASTIVIIALVPSALY
jgi:hypothetical protein